MPSSEYFLHPGELVFNVKEPNIRTIRGSCVSITAWHPILNIGGMCHFVLISSKRSKKHNEIERLDYRYGNIALDALYKKMQSVASPREFFLGLFGGSNMFPTSKSPSIVSQNVAFAKQWIADNQLQLKHENVLGDVSRTLTFDTQRGEIRLRRYQMMEEDITHGD